MYRLLIAFALLLPSPALAWWEYGHETVAKIALAEVKPATRAKVQAMMRQGALLATPTCRIDTAEGLAYWADCIKTLKDRFSYAYSWHYQNVDVCKPFDLKPACADGNCVSAQVTRNAKLLADKTLPMRERVMALAFLVHFVGDLHQPMHAGDRSDRGGNDLKSDYGSFAGSRLNIHAIWDGYLAERAISTPPGLTGLIADVRPEMASGTVEDWSREGWAVARTSVYGVLLGDPCGPKPTRATLDNAKIEALVPVVRLQVERGGMRLARLLDEALG
jgi:S1/P1 Nuclease